MPNFRFQCKTHFALNLVPFVIYCLLLFFIFFFCSFECYVLRYSYSQISLLSSLFVKICCSVSFVANFVYFRYVNSATNKCSVQLKNSTKTPSLFRCVCFFFSRSASKYDFANKKREIGKIVALLLSSNKCRIQYTFNVFSFWMCFCLDGFYGS